MNLQDLNKEQKQMLALAVMSVVVVIALGNQLILGPAKEKATSAKKMVEEKANDRTIGKRMLERDPTIQTELGEIATALLAEREGGRIPPKIGKEFWAQKRLSDIGSKLDLSLSISEHNTLRHIPVLLEGDIKPEDVSFWVPFAVEVSLQASYADLRAFIQQVHTTDPYASLASLNITASKTDPMRHDILMIYEWPTPRFEEDVDLLREYQEGSS